MDYRLSLSAESIESSVSDRFHGVGMIRSEYFCRIRGQYITILETRRAIQEYLRWVCRVFAPHPVWYRTLDMETAEVNLLEGCDRQFAEKTTLLGHRGIRRARACPDSFLLEVAMVSEVAREHANLHVLVPFLSHPDEVTFARTCLEQVGYDHRLGIMAEIPGTLLALDAFLARGVDEVTVGLNDLASLMYGAYRGLLPDSFTGPALVDSMSRAVEVCHRRGIPISIAGDFDGRVAAQAAELGFDHAVVSYSGAADVLGPALGDLPNKLDLGAIRRRARQRMGQPPADAGVEAGAS